MRLSLILIFLLVLNTITRGDEKKSLDQYWKETGLTLKTIGDHFKKDCYKNAVNYLACVQALNVVASYLEPDGVFATPSEVLKNPTVFGTLIKNYGPYNLYRMQKRNEKLSAVDAWENTSFFRKNQLQAADEVFRSKTKKIKFEGVLLELKSQVLLGDFVDSEASIAAEAYNAYLESAVDPHTHIDPRIQVEDQYASTDSTYAGIGLTIQGDEGRVIVKNVTRDGPSLEAGLRTNDIIDTVDDVKVTISGANDVSKKLKGPEGTSVKIRVLRKGNPHEFTVIRKTIVIKNVESRLVEDTCNLYGYIKLRSFMEDRACQEIYNAISDFEDKDAKGIILDLRDNPGGLLEQATCIASLFVGKQIIVKVGDVKTGKQTSYYGQNNQETSLPLVTIMNAYSASASEVLAGALQDYKRAWIVGDRSFGKATVQESSAWTDKITIAKTTARFYEPSGRTTQMVGVSPDFSIDPVPNATSEEKFSLREADYHTNALPPQGLPWTELRPKKVAEIRNCMDSDHLADSIYEKQSGDAVLPDYEVINSEVLLDCNPGP